MKETNYIQKRVVGPASAPTVLLNRAGSSWRRADLARLSGLDLAKSIRRESCSVAGGQKNLKP
jgi:hypothetical protein